MFHRELGGWSIILHLMLYSQSIIGVLHHLSQMHRAYKWRGILDSDQMYKNAQGFLERMVKTKS